MKFIFNEQNKDVVINLDKVSGFTKQSVSMTQIIFYSDAYMEYWNFRTEAERNIVFDELKRLAEAKEI